MLDITIIICSAKFYHSNPFPFRLQTPRKARNRITESQNHRIVGVGRDLCGSSSPIPLSKKGHLQ